MVSRGLLVDGATEGILWCGVDLLLAVDLWTGTTCSGTSYTGVELTSAYDVFGLMYAEVLETRRVLPEICVRIYCDSKYFVDLLTVPCPNFINGIFFCFI